MNEDMLCQIFNKQKELQESLGYNFDAMTDEELAAYVKEYAMHCDHELHEMLQEIPFFKPWKKYDTTSNSAMWYAARAEFVDALHFFLNVAIGLGFTPEMLCAMYSEKHAINHTRQENTDEYKRCVDEA